MICALDFGLLWFQTAWKSLLKRVWVCYGYNDYKAKRRFIHCASQQKNTGLKAVFLFMDTKSEISAKRIEAV